MKEQDFHFGPWLLKIPFNASSSISIRARLALSDSDSFGRDIGKSRALRRTLKKLVNKVKLLSYRQLCKRRPRRHKFQIGLENARDFFSH